MSEEDGEKNVVDAATKNVDGLAQFIVGAAHQQIDLKEGETDVALIIDSENGQAIYGIAALSYDEEKGKHVIEEVRDHGKVADLMEEHKELLKETVSYGVSEAQDPGKETKKES
jgi:hypothetical protein